ncbi:hypothetical protein [Altibacter sp. HG106]|uniref:hypothetical protein n=1 Tax=Altibacter sp. HG106 TaxID=3023937 RepID=UPI0023500922|nr:hypothetical protein [Altibacter sp. HG106]MDC7994529.1 hypothetical protein [Altibacter sp. HG106]
MKIRLLKKGLGIALMFFSMLIFNMAHAQVGINTTSPAPGSMLDIETTDKGIVIPRVDIANLATIAPVTGGSTESLLVYNTNASTGPGFFYWDSTQWVPVGTGEFWELDGNAGTTPGTGAGQHYIGTSDNQDLVIATNGTAVATMTTGGQIQSQNGTTGSPAYSFANDTNTGVYRSTADRINISAGGREMVEFREAGGSSVISFNDNGDDTDFRIEGANEDDIIFVDAGNDRLGFLEDAPQTDIHVGGTTTQIRIDAFNDTNDTNNNGVDFSPLYVDTNGNLTLEGPLIQNNMPEDNFSTFVPLATNIDSPLGTFVAQPLYNSTITLTQDALVEVVYQIGVNVTDLGLPITDGDPRQYGTALFIDTQLVGYTSECYTSSGSGTVTSGTFFLNGNGYAQLAGAAAGTTYNLQVVGFVFGANEDSVRGEFGGNVGTDRFQVIVHH